MTRYLVTFVLLALVFLAILLSGAEAGGKYYYGQYGYYPTYSYNKYLLPDTPSNNLPHYTDYFGYGYRY